MRFITLIFRNLFRRRARTLLTATGLAVAVAAVLDLVGIAWNFEKSFLTVFYSKGIDLVVIRAGVSSQLSSTIDASLADKLRAIEGVDEVALSLMDVVGFEEANLAGVLTDGWESGSMLFQGQKILEGRAFRKDESNAAMLGKILAMNLGKKVGDTVEVSGKPFKVVGTFESDSHFENGALIVPLKTLQTMMGREGQVTGLLVRAKKTDPASIAALRKRIEAALPGTAATSARDHVQADLQIRLAKAMAWTTTAIALLLGGVGMLNTMIMSVFERTKEIGILRALGWRRKRVVALILGEAVGLGLLGTVIGIGLALLGLRAIVLAPTARGFIEPDLPPAVIGLGIGLGLVLSVLGGLYPALRAASLDPTEALRHD
jgi:putative ABC transport system permease protein